MRRAAVACAHASSFETPASRAPLHEHRLGAGGWIGNDLLTELTSQPAQNAVFGFQYFLLVLSHAGLDEVEAFDHHAPEERGELSGESLVRDQAATPCRHAPVEAAERDVFAAGQGTGHHTKDLAGSVAATFDRTLTFAALSTSGSKPQP